jgi:hypothetical protein
MLAWGIDAPGPEAMDDRDRRHLARDQSLGSSSLPVSRSRESRRRSACSVLLGPKFGAPETSMRDKTVCLTGEIFLYEGKPKIILHDPKELSGG